MAVTVIPNLTDISLADSATNWVGVSGGLDLEAKIQGTASWTYQTPKNGIGNGNYTTGGINISGADNHLYWWMRCDVFPFCELKYTGTTNPSGLMVRLTSAGGSRTWHVAGRDTWRGEWKCFVLNYNDTTSSEVYNSTGTLSLAAVTLIEWLTNNTNSGTIRIIDNTWLDAVRFGKGLIATGTSFTMDDIYVEDSNSSNAYGIVQKIDGVYFVQGNLQIGDGTNTAQLNSVNETVAFRDRKVSSNLYGFLFTGSSTSVTADTMSILSSGVNDDTRPNFTVDSTVTAFTMDGSSINRGDFVVFNNNCDVQNSKFNDCNTVTPALATFQNNTVSNSNNTRAVEMDQNVSGGTTFSNNSLLNNVNALWYQWSGTYPDYSNNFNGNTYDIENSSTGLLTVNLAGTSNASTFVNTSGGTTTIVATTNLTFTGLKPDTELRIYTSGLTTELYGVESITGSTTYQYGTSDWQTGAIVQIYATNYIPQRLVIDLDGTDSSIPIQQIFDRNYSNPA